jgi:predicted RNase H-like nuclease (RuvC/YqgF family)
MSNVPHQCESFILDGEQCTRTQTKLYDDGHYYCFQHIPNGVQLVQVVADEIDDKHPDVVFRDAEIERIAGQLRDSQNNNRNLQEQLGIACSENTNLNVNIENLNADIERLTNEVQALRLASAQRARSQAEEARAAQAQAYNAFAVLYQSRANWEANQLNSRNNFDGMMLNAIERRTNGQAFTYNAILTNTMNTLQQPNIPPPPAPVVISAGLLSGSALPWYEEIRRRPE